MTTAEQKKAAREFAGRWAGRGYEKGECQKFWRALLHDVFGIADPDDWVQYEVPVATGFVDAYISRTKVVVEQKGFEHGLEDKAAMKQAMMYVGAMPDTMPVRYVVLSNFREFWIYDKHAPEMKPVKVALSDLPRKLRVFSFLTEVRQAVPAVHDVAAVDRRAGALVGKLYDALLKSYSGETDERTLESLNMLCVRLVFCAYAEDAGVFPKRDQFVDYMRRYDAESFRDRLAQLFRMLNTDYPERDPDDIPALLEFPYVGSGLFDDEHIRIPRFTDETRHLLLECMCADLDWTEINPTIFGAVFESTLSTAMRRKNGMHYTTVKNIHRVVDPLFLESYERELDAIATVGNVRRRNVSLVAFQKRLGGLAFLDPACGSGNFLTETYLSLRRLENRAIALRQQGQGEFDFGDTICVTIDQFYGIEIDDFAVSVAQTALWIAESQMMIETERILHRQIEFLPLKRYAHIVKGNALRMDWNALLVDAASLPRQESSRRFDYILGNPPFVGYSNQSPQQKDDMLSTFVDAKGRPLKTAGKIDYVAAWYWKACEYGGRAGRATLPSNDNDVSAPVGSAPRADRTSDGGRGMRPACPRCAFVSTNSICQGEQVAAVWKPLKERFGVEIDFAWRTFVWDSEASEKAHVHVVIVGFHAEGNVPCRDGEGSNAESQRSRDDGVTPVGSRVPRDRTRRLFSDDGTFVTVAHINGYLMDGPDVFVESRTKPLCDVPQLLNGGKPAEGGSLILSKEEKDNLIASEPLAIKWIRPYMMGKDFINRVPRYCLWLVGAQPGELRKCRSVVSRVEEVRAFRMKSPKAVTREKASTPTLFEEVRVCDTDYIAIPKVSSQRRMYVPMDWLEHEIVPGDKLFMLPGSSLFIFGVLTSSVHMAWLRVVCGRLKSDYSYSNTIVYNNFPWPENPVNPVNPVESDLRATVTPCEKIPCNPCNPWFEQISQTAQAILDARALYPDSSLADLYDPLTMPPELRKAHQANDRAVLAAYGFPPDLDESSIVAKLFEMYEKLIYCAGQSK